MGIWPGSAAGDSATAEASPLHVRPMILADVLDGMFDLLTAHWRAYVLTAGIVLVPLNFVLAYLSSEVYGGAGLIEQLSNPATTEAFMAGGPNWAPFVGVIVVSGISGLLVTPFVYGVACRVASEAYERREPSAGAVLRTILGRYWALVGVTVLLALAVVVVLAVPGALIAVGVATEAVPLAAIGGLLLLVGGVAAAFLVVRLSLSYVVVVVERGNPITALRRSWELVGGRFWRILGTLALASLISGFVAQIIAIPFSLPGSLFGDWAGIVFAAVGGVVASVLTTPLVANAQTLLYYDARVRSEAFDLEVASRSMLDPAGARIG